MQLKQTKHSDLRKTEWGSQAPWHLWRQRLQPVHFCMSRSIRQIENRERMPRTAPSGQSTRQKNRGMTRFMETKKKRRNPTTHPN